MRLIKGKTFYKKPWYESWRAMMDRCYRKTAHNYKRYGDRGIIVCDEWKNIENFGKWCEQSGYEEGLTLERIDVNGNYEPSNCCWATRKQQANNRGNTVRITFQNKTHTLSEWAEITGINRSTLNNRYHRGKRGAELFAKGRLGCHA